jgi:hypothetical protein
MGRPNRKHRFLTILSLLFAYSLQRERVYRAVVQQWTSTLVPLLRLSGVMSQHLWFRGHWFFFLKNPRRDTKPQTTCSSTVRHFTLFSQQKWQLKKQALRTLICYTHLSLNKLILTININHTTSTSAFNEFLFFTLRHFVCIHPHPYHLPTRDY